MRDSIKLLINQLKNKFTKKRVVGLTTTLLFIIGVVSYAFATGSWTFGGNTNREHSAANAAPNSYYALKWKVNIGGSYTAPVVDESTHRIYALGDWGYAYCLDAKTGATIWSIAGVGTTTSSMTFDGTYLYFGTDGGYYYVLRASDGAVVASASLDGPVVSSPIVASGKVFLGTKAGSIYAFNQGASSTLSWHKTYSGQVTSSPVTDGSFVYFGIDNDASASVEQLSVDSGVENSTTPTYYGVAGSLGFLGGGNLFAADKKGDIYKINPGTMMQIAVDRTIFNSSNFNNHSVSDESYGGYVYASLNNYSGGPGAVAQWSNDLKFQAMFTPDGTVTTTAAEDSNNRILWVGDDTGKIYGIYPGSMNATNWFVDSSGNISNTFNTGGSVTGEIALGDGMMLTTSQDGYLYAFAPLPNITVSGYKWLNSSGSAISDNGFAVGQAYTLRGIFANNKNSYLDAGRFTVEAKVDGVSLGMKTISSLPKGNTTSMDWSWTPSSAGNHTVTFYANQDKSLPELIYADNTLSHSISAVTGTPPVSVALTNLTITPSTATISVNGTQKYQAIATFSDSSQKDVSTDPGTAWSTGSSSIATIDNTGLAKGVDGGSTKVFATYQGETANADLTVEFVPPIPSIKGNVDPRQGYPGQIVTITAFLGSDTTSGLVKDNRGTTINIPKSGTYSYTIPTDTKIGQVMTLQFYAVNQWYGAVPGPKYRVNVVNPITINGSANPLTLAPTEYSNITAQTTGFVNRVKVTGKITTPDDYNPDYSSQIAVGFGSLAAAMPDGSAWTWGDNYFGQLGNNATPPGNNYPQKVPSLSNIKSVDIGYGAGRYKSADGNEWDGTDSIFFVKSDGTLWATGNNDYGQLGIGNKLKQSSPVQITGISDVTAVAGGYRHALAVKSDGTVWAWGWNYSGQLGDGTTTDKLIPQQVPGLSNVIAVKAGAKFSVALKKDGTVWAWGDDYYYELGNSTRTRSTVPIQVSGISGVISISAGSYSVTALKSDGTVWNWGLRDAYDYDYGDGAFTSTIIIGKIPTQIAGLTGVTAIASGDSFTIVLKNDGTVWAWGNNTFGSLGNNSSSYGYQTLITQIQGLSNVVAIKAGWATVAAVQNDGQVWDWGVVYSDSDQIQFQTDLSGALGNGYESINYPVLVTIPSHFTSIVNNGYHTIATKNDGSVWLWGGNYEDTAIVSYKQYSTPQIMTDQNVVDVKQVVSGAYHSAALKNDGSVWTWGQNGSGQLGNGTTTASDPFQHYNPPYHSFDGAVSIAAGYSTTFAIKADGTLWGWGANSSYYLTTSSGGVYGTPRQRAGIDNLQSVSVGQSFVIALKKDGTVWSWGSNTYGALGDGTTADRINPIQIPGLSNIVAVAAGYNYALALASDGTLWAWGTNNYGQLGIGNTTRQLSPVKVPITTNIKSIVAGQYSTYVLLQDGTLWDWGYNNDNLGDGTTATKLSPQQVPNVSGLTSITGGNWAYSGFLGLKADGTYISFGYNAQGQLGTGNSNNISTPYQSPQGLPDSFLLIPPSLDSITLSDLTPSDSSFPSSNTWTGSIQVPYYVPVGSKFEITLTAYSTWSYLNNTYPTVTKKIILDIENTLILSQPTASKTNVAPGDTITLTVPSSNGYVLSVTASGSDGAGGTKTVYMTPTTPVNTIPKTNSWTANYQIPTNAPVGVYTITFIGTNNYFFNQPPSAPKYLNLVVGSPPVSVTGEPSVTPDPVYSHRDGQNIVTVTTTTQGSVGRVTLNASSTTLVNNIKTPYSIALPDMTSADNTHWRETYQIPDNIPEGTILTFQLNVIASNGAYSYGPVYVSVTVRRYLMATGSVSPSSGYPGQVLSLNGSSTSGHASSFAVTDNLGNSVSLTTADTSLGSNTWNESYTIPATAKIGDYITLTWTPTDTVSGTNFIGQRDVKDIIVANTPMIKSVEWQQESPYPGAHSGAPTGTVTAIITTTGWVNTLNVSWDTSYNIAPTSYVDLDSSGTRQWTFKGLVVPSNADVSNVMQTLLYIKGQTPFIDGATGVNQEIRDTAILPIDNTIVTTAQQLTNPIVMPGNSVTITVKTTGFATIVYAKKMDGSLLALTPSSSVSPTIPFANTWTATYAIPSGTASQLFKIPVYARNTVFLNQPDSAYDYIDINIGGVPNLISATLTPYEINLPANNASDRTISLSSRTTGNVSGIQVKLSINGGTATILDSSTMSKFFGTVPGAVDWVGNDIIDPSTPDGTTLTFSFQAKDSGGIPTGNIITLQNVVVHQTRPPIVIITH